MSSRKPAIGRVERLPFERLDPTLQETLRARVERLGYLGEFFQCAAHQPGILVPFMEMTEALKRALPERLTEVGALTVACLMGNDYERHQHERLAKALGFGEAWIADVERLQPDLAPQLSDGERAVQRLVIATIEGRGKGCGEAFHAVVDAIGPAAAIAVLFLVGRYLTHAVVVNVLGLAAPVVSIFAGDRP